MNYTILDLGTLRVNAFEMIMGVPEDMIREQYKVDEQDQMRIGMNGMIVEDGDKVIMIDPGTATFLPKSLEELYDLKMEYSLEEVVNQAGYDVGEITDVLFTHLHFDHGSGALKRIIGGINPVFPNARHVVSKLHLEYIQNESKAERNSFFEKLLRYVGEVTYFEEWECESIRFVRSHGHTGQMLVPVIADIDHDILYATDLIPMKLHNRKEAWSYYDVDKELLEKEREGVLRSLRPGYEIVYYHEISKKQKGRSKK